MINHKFVTTTNSKSPANIKHDVISQVKSGISCMDGKSYKCNGMDSYSPC